MVYGLDHIAGFAHSFRVVVTMVYSHLEHEFAIFRISGRFKCLLRYHNHVDVDHHPLLHYSMVLICNGMVLMCNGMVLISDGTTVQ